MHVLTPHHNTHMYGDDRIHATSVPQRAMPLPLDVACALSAHRSVTHLTFKSQSIGVCIVAFTCVSHLTAGYQHAQAAQVAVCVDISAHNLTTPSNHFSVRDDPVPGMPSMAVGLGASTVHPTIKHI